MVLSTLPQDVLATIVDIGPFSRHDLCMISLASPHLRYESQRRLFRDPGPHLINVQFNVESSDSTKTFLEAVTVSPDRLALMVRRFHITVSWFDFHVRFEPEKRHLELTLFDHLSRALQLMVNLKEICYHESLGLAETRPTPVPPPSIWPVFGMCSFRLQSFRCSYIGMDNRDALAGFLHSQPGIRELWLSEAPKSRTANSFLPLQSIFKNVCPSLVSLGGMTEIVAGMLAGRETLQHMSWEEDIHNATTVKYTPALFCSMNTGSVELMESIRCGPPLGLICELFKNLVVLNTCEHDVTQELDVLKALQRLRVLILGFEITPSLGGSEVPMVRRVFSQLLPLECLECRRSADDVDDKYLIDRDTQVVTCYKITRSLFSLTAGGRNDMLRKVYESGHIDGDHVFEKSFAM